MAKLRGKAKAAFLRRMANGRRKVSRRVARGGHVRRRSKSRAPSAAYTERLQSLLARGFPHAEAVNHARYYASTRARRRKRGGSMARRRPSAAPRRRRNPSVLIANPGYSAAYASGWDRVFGKKKRKKRKTKRKGTSTMAKRRKARKSRKGRARRGRARRRIYTVRPGRRARTIYINPGRKRRRKRRRGSVGGRRLRRFRRKNPGRGGFVSSIKAAFTPLVAGALTGMASAALDAALAKYPTGKKLAKVGGAIAIAMFGRRYPRAACAAIGALAATEGYNIGSRLVGGMGAVQKPEQVPKEMAKMGETYPEIGALLDGGVGALLEGVPNEGQSVAHYAAALSNMADGDDD